MPQKLAGYTYPQVYCPPMARKTSLYLDADTETILSVRDGAPIEQRRLGRRSQLLRAFVRRYAEVCERDLPALGRADWKFVIEASRDRNRPPVLGEPGEPRTFVGLLLEACHRAGRTDLAERLSTTTHGQRIALLDAVERHWAALDRGETPPPLRRTA